MASSEGLRGVARGPAAVAVGSAFAALAASFLVAGISQHWLVFAVAQTIFSFTPDTLVAFGITRLGDLSQPLLVVAATVLSVTLFAGSTLLVVGISAASGRAGAETVFAVGVVQTLLGFFLTISPLPSLAGGVAGGAVVGLASLDTTDEAVPRRRLLRSLGAAGATVGLGGLFAGRRLTQLNLGESEEASREIDDPLVATLLETAAERSLDVPVAEPLVSADFYQVDINTVDPQVDPASWSLSITGAVEEEVSFALPDLREFSTEHRFVSLRCVGDNLNGRKLDTALWTGVPASELLDTAGVPDSETCCVMLRAEDGYYMEFPLAALEDALLVFEMNGRRLPRGHGAPVRALIPGHWGEINVKWLSEIEILTEEQKGYWEKKGWHGTGPVNTVAKLHGIDTGGSTVTVGGRAYAGTRGISAVQVSTDGGDTWAEAEVSEPLPDRVPTDTDPSDPSVTDGRASDAARMWRYEYEASERHEVVVRAVEADGTIQPRQQGNGKPFPSGVTGWVSKTIEP